MKGNIVLPKEKITDFCQRHHIRQLALFGSVLRNDFRPDSDVDVLVEFKPGYTPGFISLYDMEEELSTFMEGRKVDLVTAKFLNHRMRDKVFSEAEVQYAEG
jgi:uncharacterized protein